MNTNYSINPKLEGQYYTNDVSVINSANRLATLDAFSIMLDTSMKEERSEIMEVKARKSVPERMTSIGTTTSKSCNLPGININRFENPHCNVQNPNSIIVNEPFRGGLPSRIVEKDLYVKNHN